MYKANSDSSGDGSLEEVVLQYLPSNGETIVAQLYDALSITHPELTKAKTTDLVWRLVNQRKLELEYPRESTFVQFLGHWEMNLGIYATFAVSLMLLVGINVIPVSSRFVFLRWVLGSAFVLLLPGYVATDALFPKAGELGSIERVALSIGLSLAFVLFVGLLLNYTSWGIQVLPIVVSLTSITIMLGTVALLRRYAHA